MKKTIEKFLLRYTVPKNIGMSAEELANMLREELEYTETRQARKDSEPKCESDCCEKSI